MTDCCDLYQYCVFQPVWNEEYFNNGNLVLKNYWSNLSLLCSRNEVNNYERLKFMFVSKCCLIRHEITPCKWNGPVLSIELHLFLLAFVKHLCFRTLVRVDVLFRSIYSFLFKYIYETFNILIIVAIFALTRNTFKTGVKICLFSGSKYSLMRSRFWLNEIGLWCWPKLDKIQHIKMLTF